MFSMKGLSVKMRRHPREGGDPVNTVHGERVEPFNEMLLNSFALRSTVATEMSPMLSCSHDVIQTR